VGGTHVEDRESKPTDKLFSLQDALRVEEVRANEGEDLFVFDAYVQDQAVRVLCDSGASGLYASLGLVKEIGARVEPIERQEVLLPNKSKMTSLGTCTLRIRVQNWSREITLTVLDISGFDIILGMQFLKMHGAKADFERGILTLPVVGEFPAVEIEKSRPRIYNLGTSSNTATCEEVNERYIRKLSDTDGTQFRLYVVQGTTNPEDTVCQGSDSRAIRTEDERLDNVLRKFSAVFSSQLPDKASNDQKSGHSIDTGDAHPINLPSYSLSHLETGGDKASNRAFVQKDDTRIVKPLGFSCSFCEEKGGNLEDVY